MFKKIIKFYPLLIVLFLYFVLGISVFKDYGISYGEIEYLHNGHRYFEYMSQPGMYSFYHFINFFLFTAVLIFSYLVVYKKYHDIHKAVLGPFFILIIPRITGEIFINPFDISFLIVYFTALSLIYFLNHSGSKILNDLIFKSIVLGITFGIAQSLKTWGFTLYIIYLASTLHNMLVLHKENAESTKKSIIIKSLRELILIATFALLVSLLLKPDLGDLFNNFTHLVKEETLYLGRFVSSQKLPFHYPLVWLLVTTPFSILALFTISLLTIFRKIKDELHFLLFFSLIVNVVFYYFFKPPLFDGIRHLLFLLPIIAVLSSLTFIEILWAEKNEVFKQLFIAIIFLHFATVIYDMHRLHPYEYVYFNETVGKYHGAQRIFEGEYWKTSYKDSSDWILRDMQTNNIGAANVFTCEMDKAVQIFGKEVFELAENEKQGDYIICTHRIFDTEFDYTVNIDGVTVNSVTKVTK